MTRRPTCRHCPGRPQYPNPIKLRAHVLEDHPEKRQSTTYRLIDQPRGPRPGGSLKRDPDAYPGRP